jgi:hypothetical protein
MNNVHVKALPGQCPHERAAAFGTEINREKLRRHFKSPLTQSKPGRTFGCTQPEINRKVQTRAETVNPDAGSRKTHPNT